MPKTRQPKRSGSASSGKSEKRVKRVTKIPTGENKAGLTPAIPFCEAVKDVNDADDKYVSSIKVKIDPGKADSQVNNLEDKKFLKITDLTYNGALVTKVRRSSYRYSSLLVVAVVLSVEVASCCSFSCSSSCIQCV